MPSRDVDRRGDLLEQTLGHDRGLRRLADCRQQDGELVTAEPRYRVARPDHALQAPSERGKHFVADAVPVLVVDLLELVEVDEDDRRAGSVLRPHRDCMLELLVEEGTVCEPGERIEECL